MTITEILQSVQFVVDQQGKPSAALLDMRAWEALLSLLEDVEDAEIVRARLKNWRSKEGWSDWQDVEAELDDEALQNLG
jgi:hypothetical protein